MTSFLEQLDSFYFNIYKKKPKGYRLVIQENYNYIEELTHHDKSKLKQKKIKKKQNLNSKENADKQFQLTQDVPSQTNKDQDQNTDSLVLSKPLEEFKSFDSYEMKLLQNSFEQQNLNECEQNQNIQEPNIQSKQTQINKKKPKKQKQNQNNVCNIATKDVLSQLMTNNTLYQVEVQLVNSCFGRIESDPVREIVSHCYGYNPDGNNFQLELYLEARFLPRFDGSIPENIHINQKQAILFCKQEFEDYIKSNKEFFSNDIKFYLQ